MLGLVAFLAASYAVAALGSLSMGDWSGWYAGLSKPSWTPPGALIGAVWSVLYGLIGVAGWLVWRERSTHRRGALVAFGVQLALNLAWSWIFFGLRAPGLALVEILVLLAAILATIGLFAKVRRLAAGLLVPYAAWVAFASFLNATIWWLNRA